MRILPLLLAVLLAGCSMTPVDPAEQRRVLVRAYWYSLDRGGLP